MIWNNIRLELASMERFPRGSASRAFLLRLPLQIDGSIDAAAVQLCPTLATVRRFWASEPDLAGEVVREGGAWLFRCGRAPGGIMDFRLNAPALKLDRQVLIEAPDGSRLPFRVARVSPLANAAASAS